MPACPSTYHHHHHHRPEIENRRRKPIRDGSDGIRGDGRLTPDIGRFCGCAASGFSVACSSSTAPAARLTSTSTTSSTTLPRVTPSSTSVRSLSTYVPRPSNLVDKEGEVLTRHHRSTVPRLRRPARGRSRRRWTPSVPAPRLLASASRRGRRRSGTR